MDLKEVWLIDYARTAFSRSRPKQPERDVFGEIRSDELLAKLLMKFFDQKLADKGIEKKDVDEFTVGTAMGVYENWTYGGRLPLFLAICLAGGVEHMTRVDMQNTHISPNLKMINKKSEWYQHSRKKIWTNLG